MYRPLAAICAARSRAAGRHQGQPQPAVRAEALLRGEVVHVALAELDRQAAGPARRVHDDQGARIGTRDAADRHGHAGRGLVVGQRVGVHPGLAARHRVGPGRRGDHRRVVQPRGRLRHLAELGRELAERQVLRLLLDQAERGDLPERGGAAVAQHDLVPVGQPEQLGQALAGPPDQRPDRGLPVRGAQVGGARGGQRGQLLGTHLGRTAAEPPVGGLEPSGNDDVGHGSYPEGTPRIPRSPLAPNGARRARACGAPRRARACRAPAQTSSNTWSAPGTLLTGRDAGPM